MPPGNAHPSRQPKSLGEVAAILGVTRTTVHQAEKRAMKKIRFNVQCEARAAGVSIREWLFGEIK